MQRGKIRSSSHCHDGSYPCEVISDASCARLGKIVLKGSVTPDLDSVDEIRRLVLLFYSRVEKDDLLGPVFTAAVGDRWDEHHDTLIAFWAKSVLGVPGFRGNPTGKHSALSKVTPFRAEQFGRWVALFHDTVDGGWAGPKADLIKERAVFIAQIQSRMVVDAETWDGPASLNS